MGNAKSPVLVITPLMFLVSGAICSQLFVQSVLAAPPPLCDPGLPDCTSSSWDPPATTDEGTSPTTPLPAVPPGKPLIGDLIPEGGGTQPQTQPDESDDRGEDPEDDQPEQDEEPSNEGQDVSSEGGDTTGNLN